MIYLPQLKLCFVHLPKTAGTWVRMALRVSGFELQEYPKQLEHADLEEASRHVPEKTEYFTLVRHPFSWLRSYWVDRQLKGWGGDLAIGRECQSDLFEGFVEQVCEIRPGYLTELYGRYAGSIVTDARIPTLSCAALRAEKPAPGLLDILWRKSPIPFTTSAIANLPPVNIGAAYPGFRHKTEGNVDLFRLVRSCEPEIYKLFGYDTEPPDRLEVDQL